MTKKRSAIASLPQNDRAKFGMQDGNGGGNAPNGATHGQEHREKERNKRKRTYRHESGDLLSVLDELHTDTLPNSRVGLLGFNSDLFQHNTLRVRGSTSR